MSIKYFLLCCLLLAAPLAADPPLTIAEMVDIALKNHPSTRQAWWNASRAAAVVGTAQSAYYPSVEVDATIQNGRDFKFINGPDVDYTIIGADLILNMMLLDFGERGANVKAAKMSLLAANWQADWNIQKVMVAVLENAYMVLHAQEAVLAAQSSLQDAEKVLYTARELNRTGLTPISDVYSSQSTLSQMKMDLTQQKSTLDIQKGKLASSLGFSADVQLDLAPVELPQAPQQQQTDALIDLAMRQRVDLMAKQAKLYESYAYQDKARSGYMPKVSFNGRGGANHALHDKTNAAQYRVALNLEIPLFNGFETVYNNRKAYAETQMTQEELSALQLNIALEVLTSSRTLESYQEMLPDAEDNLNNALKAYESVLEKYRHGKERIGEVSIAQRQLAAARVRYSDVKTRLLVSIANLAFATGTLECP